MNLDERATSLKDAVAAFKQQMAAEVLAQLGPELERGAVLAALRSLPS